MVISCTPLGKLLYIPDVGVPGLKINFLLASLIAMWYFLELFLRKVYDSRFVIPLLALFPVILSLFFLEDRFSGVFHSAYDGQRDSVPLRVFSFAILLGMALKLAWLIGEDKTKRFLFDCMEAYLAACFFAIGAGLIFSVSMWYGFISIEDLQPVSADVHEINGFYRFNPGANVNEFGMIIGYALIFLFLLGENWSKTKRSFAVILLLLALLAGLTRAAWIALACAVVVICFYRPRYFIPMVGILLVIGVICCVCALQSDSIAFLLESRFSLELGAGGEDRMEKFQSSLLALNDSTGSFFLGHGWGTNLYAHGFFFQLLYELGIFNQLIFLFFLILPIGGIFLRSVNSRYFGSGMMALCVFAFIIAFLHHTIYHVQTWIIYGMCLAYSVSGGCRICGIALNDSLELRGLD